MNGDGNLLGKKQIESEKEKERKTDLWKGKRNYCGFCHLVTSGHPSTAPLIVSRLMPESVFIRVNH